MDLNSVLSSIESFHVILGAFLEFSVFLYLKNRYIEFMGKGERFSEITEINQCISVKKALLLNNIFAYNMCGILRVYYKTY